MFTPRLFSIGPNEKIIFSPGNLQFNLHCNSWHFASSQLEIIGFHNSNCMGKNGCIDLFGWGSAMPPHTRSKQKRDYKGYFKDWGQYLPPSNRSNWFTLSNKQWEYLLEKREDAMNKYAFSEIDGNIGVILFPDQCSLPPNIVIKNILPDYLDDTDNLNCLECRSYPRYINHFTPEEWDVLECYGCVYLPFGGDRYGDLVRDVNEVGWYWTSDFHSNMSGDRKGGVLLLRSNGSYEIDSYFAPYGLSVRLVKKPYL